MANFLADEEFVQKRLAMFIAFMGRDGYSEQMAREEFPRLRATVGLNGCPRTYMRVQRTGSRFPLDRHASERIAGVYHHSSAHAYFGYQKSMDTEPGLAAP
jgi:hypothetical protein